jgi:hypothetical protein
MSDLKKLVELYKSKAAQCNQADCKDWWLAKAYAIEQVMGKRKQSEGVVEDEDPSL